MKKFIVVLLLLLFAGCEEHVCVKLKVMCENGKDYFVESCVEQTSGRYGADFLEKPTPIDVVDCKIKQMKIVKIGNPR